MLKRLVLGKAAAAVDNALVAVARLQSGRARSRSSAVRLSHDERLRALAEIREAYGAGELVSDPDAFFVPPAPIAPRLAPVRKLPRRGEVVDASWPSEFEPFLRGLRDKYLGHVPNRTAHARLFLGPEPRPAVVLIHGYMAGQWAIEERAWPVEWLHRRGMDAAIAVLPFHALRASPDRKGPPPFPGADPRFTNEGFRQAMGDLRALIAFLRARGAPSVGVMGMSLGGFSTSLLATIEPDLSFAVPLIPLASLADFARDQGRLGSGAEADLQHPALEAANFVVSPFARPSLVAKERVLVLGAEADRITPIAHAERLARHFDARLVRLEGGHILQLWRRQAFREVGKLLAGLGQFAPRA